MPDRKRGRRPAPATAVPLFDLPDTPGIEEDVDLSGLLSSLFEVGADLLTCSDPLEVEVLGAAFGGAAGFGEGIEEGLADGLVPFAAAQGTAEAMALLLAMASINVGRLSEAARSAANQLAGSGLPRPAWFAELSQPVTAGEFWLSRDSVGKASVLVGSFHRAGRSHALVVSLDHIRCGEASEIGLLDVADVDLLVEEMNDSAGAHGVSLSRQDLDPAEFRWRAETALQVRDDHDQQGLGRADPLDGDDDGPGFSALRALLRVRLDTLPRSHRRAPRHSQHGRGLFGSAGLELIAQALLGRPTGATRQPSVPLPRKRTKADPPPPIYQIKVSLVGAKPPIWRRLEVPGNVSLDRLHRLIQNAFEWQDYHLHQFATPHGDFGTPGADLDHRSDKAVTLEQVAPQVKSKIRYTYDFGDDWDHDIVVEKIQEPEADVSYPRCVGGKRAAPPEDCGGIGGYEELVAQAGFDPEEFDLAAINRRLGPRRRPAGRPARA